MSSMYVCIICFFTIFYLTFYSIYSFTLILNLTLCFFLKNFLLIIYSLNLALCLHLAINSLLLFNNFFGSGKNNVDFFLKTQIAPTIKRIWDTRSF